MPVLYEYHDGKLVHVKMCTNTWYEMKEIVDRKYKYRRNNPVPGVKRITIGWDHSPDALSLKRRSSIYQKGAQHG